MAITKEALTYLQELETLENWTDIPDDDKRIIKLRKLFAYDPEVEILKNGKPEPKNKYGKKIVATIHGIEITFNNTKDCAEAMGFNLNSLKSCIAKKVPHKGILFERVEE